ISPARRVPRAPTRPSQDSSHSSISSSVVFLELTEVVSSVIAGFPSHGVPGPGDLMDPGSRRCRISGLPETCPGSPETDGACSADAVDLCRGVLVPLHRVTGEGGLDEPVRAVGDDEDLVRVLQSEAFDVVEEVMLVRAGEADLVDLRHGLDDLLAHLVQSV